MPRIPEVESVASRSVEELNALLARKGFAIRLNPFQTPQDFGTVSVLDVLVRWLQPGDVRPIRTRGREYPGVRIPEKGGRVFFLRHRMFRSPIACLRTQTDDLVYLTAADANECPDLTTSIVRLPGVGSDDVAMDHGFGGIVFPMVSLDHSVNISWLLGLATEGTDGLPAVITQAKQQTRFRMNEIGARAESAVAFGMLRLAMEVPKPDLVIDQPFACWIERPGVPSPLFFGHITEKDWKNPGSLGR